MRSNVLVVLAAVGVLGCTPEGGGDMRPGDDCLRCHGGHPGGPESGPVDHEDAFTLAGTVYGSPDAGVNTGVEGVSVDVTDATGSRIELRSNSAGNFYTAGPIVFPVQVCVAHDGGVRCMTTPAPNGACNYCHALPPNGGAPGRISAP